MLFLAWISPAEFGVCTSKRVPSRSDRRSELDTENFFIASEINPPPPQQISGNIPKIAHCLRDRSRGAGGGALKGFASRRNHRGTPEMSRGSWYA
eukprot:94201-Rhodomonas_salina.1